MKKGIIILGSSNSFGETRKLADYVSYKSKFPILDLKTKNIGEYDYEYKNKNDDYILLIQEIVMSYQLMVFATPVYWYNMSGILKTFIDRFSDLLRVEKDTGRKLRGMEMAVISCGSDKELKPGYHMPFKESAKYLGMHYIADVHGWIDNNEIPEEVKLNLDNFIIKIK